MTIEAREPAFWGMFPERASPLADDVECATLSWLERMRLVDDPRAIDRIKRSTIGLGMARAYPEATFDVLVLAADINLFLTVFDDVHGEPARADPAGLAERVGIFLRILADPEVCPATAGFEGALRDVAIRLARHTTSVQAARIRSAIRGVLFGMMWESHADNVAHRVSIDDYIVMRRIIVFADLILALAEPGNGLELPQDQRFTPVVTSAETAVANVIGWINDIFSGRWENDHGRCLNLVNLIARDRKCDLAAACEVAVQMCDDEAGRVLQLTARMAESPDAAVRRYADALRVVMMSTDWHRNNRRYA